MIYDTQARYKRKHYPNPVQIRTLFRDVVFNLQAKQKTTREKHPSPKHCKYGRNVEIGNLQP